MLAVQYTSGYGKMFQDTTFNQIYKTIIKRFYLEKKMRLGGYLERGWCVDRQPFLLCGAFVSLKSLKVPETVSK